MFLLLIASTARVLASDVAPPGVITPLSPLVSTDTATPSFEWEDLGDVDTYRLKVISPGSNPVSVYESYESGSICSDGICSVVPAGVVINEGDENFWRVRAGNAAGWNVWSSKWFFDFDASAGTNLPGVITPLSPLVSTDTATPSFEWEDLGNADTYRLRVKSPGSNPVSVYESYESGSICSDGICSVVPAGVVINEGDENFWRVRARNAAGWNDWSSRWYYEFDNVAPDAPANLVVNDRTSTSITLMWDSVQDPDLVGYRISRDGNLVLQTDSTVFTNNNLSPDTTYNYDVRAIDDAGNISDPATVIIKTKPDSGGDQCNELDDGLLNYYTFDTLLNGQFIDQTGIQDGTFADVTPTNGQLNNAVAFTENSSLSLGNYSPAVANGLTISAWIKPLSGGSSEARFLSKATGVQEQDHHIMIGSYLEDRLRFRLKAGGVTKTLISAPGVLIDNQWNFVTFSYDLQWMRIFLNGDQIAQTSKTGLVSTDNSVPMAIGNQPSQAGDRPFVGDIDEVRIYGRALSDTEIASLMDLHSESCGTALSAPSSLNATLADSAVDLTWSSPALPGAGVDYYEVARDGVLIAVNVNGTFYSDTTLSSYGIYRYTVRAVDVLANVSTMSAPVVIDTIAAIDSQPPSMPTNLDSSAVTSAALTISWDVSIDYGFSGLQGYRIYRDNVLLATVPNNVFTDSGLIASTSYTYTVEALDNEGNVSPAAELEVATIADEVAPPQPVNLQFDTILSTRISFSWDDVSDIGSAGLAGYLIYKNGQQILLSVHAEFTDESVSAEDDVTYEVSAIDNAGNESPVSAIAITVPSDTQTNDNWPSISAGDLPLAGVFYGVPRAGHQTGNASIGKDHSRRFRAEKTGFVNAIRYQNRLLTQQTIDQRCAAFGPQSVWCQCIDAGLDEFTCGYALGSAYHVGNGGEITIEIRPDDGTDNHHPAETVFGKTSDPFVPTDDQDTPNGFPVLELENPVHLTQGLLYHLVYINSNPPTTCAFSAVPPVAAFDCPRDQGAISLNGTWYGQIAPTTGVSAGKWGPYYGNTGAGNLTRNSGDWSEKPNTLSWFELQYDDGTWVGDRYVGG
ncbi:MAG: fibronectin type III domain-containing protein, partial [Acidiferrobacterales bacterium]|nr:fibronectin type III domain-containing protein [Acidiferrobacterales bacterium]